MIPIFLYSDVYDNENVTICNILLPQNDYIDAHQAFTLYSFTLGFCAPILLIVFYNIRIIIELISKRPTNFSNNKKDNSKKVTYLLIVLIFVYILCWLPHWFTQILLITLQPNEVSNGLKYFIIITGCMAYANSGHYPLLIFFFH
jgi:hypothetical protein